MRALVGLEGFQNFESVHARQFDIEKDDFMRKAGPESEVFAMAENAIDGILPVPAIIHLDMDVISQQRHLEEFFVVRVILDEEDFCAVEHSHRKNPCPRSVCGVFANIEKGNGSVNG